MIERSAIFRRSEVQKLLRAIRDDEIKGIEPIFSYEHGLRYPDAEGITGASAEALKTTLKELSGVGILIPETRNKVLVCPKCGTHRLMIQLRCPHCGSPDIKRGAAIEHLACGHIDFEGGFKRGEQLICPKCGKTLRTIGVDYRRPGTIYKCRSCGEMFPNPKKRYTCSEGHVLDEQELVLRDVPAYRINPAKRALIERETLEFKPILEALTDRGWYGQAPVTIWDKNKIEHTFAFALWAPESDPAEGQPDVLADAYTSEGEVNSTMVLAFYAKTMGFMPRDRVLIVMPRLSKRAKALAESYNISVVEAEAASELTEKARKALLNMVQRRRKDTLTAEAEALGIALKELK